jgi:hypothetical protein
MQMGLADEGAQSRCATQTAHTRGGKVHGDSVRGFRFEVRGKDRYGDSGCARMTSQKRSEHLFDIPSGAKAPLIFHPLRTG